MRRLRRAEIVSRSMPPELSEPSLSSTTAPTGRSAVSAASCFRLSPMRVAGAAGGACSSLGSVDAREASIEAVEARLKFFLEFGKRAVFEGFGGLRFARCALVGDGHAARIVDEDGDDVLLRFQLGDGDCGLPQEHEHDRGENDLEKPDHARAPIADGGGCLREPLADQDRQPSGGGQHEQQTEPTSASRREGRTRPSKKSPPDT